MLVALGVRYMGYTLYSPNIRMYCRPNDTRKTGFKRGEEKAKEGVLKPQDSHVHWDEGQPLSGWCLTTCQRAPPLTICQGCKASPSEKSIKWLKPFQQNQSIAAQSPALCDRAVCRNAS